MKLHTYHLTIFFSCIFLLAIFFRIYRLTEAPPALHGDELGVGYNAYTLLKTGRDEYGRFLPLTFRSDFTPLIFYATIPSVALFGLTEFATRFPTALIGILTIPVVYLLVYELTNQKKLAFVTMFLIALSSWHIRTSRIALELTWALFFQIIAITFFLKSLKGDRKNLILSFIVFGVSIFSYHSTKMTTPLLLLGLLTFYRKQVSPIMSKMALCVLFGICIVLPLLIYFYAQQFSQIRFVGISVFTLWKNSYPAGTQLFTIIPLSDLIIMIFKNYLIHFDPRLLFLENGRLRYFHLSGLGLFYIWQAPFLLIGLFRLISQTKQKLHWVKFILFWILLAPLPAAFTTGVPYANIGRILLLLPVGEFVTAYGINIVRKSCLIKTFITFGVMLSTAYFLQQYFVIVPHITDNFWGVQWRTTAKIAATYENDVNHIIITNPTHQSYMYVLFYTNKSPQWIFGAEKQRAKDIGYSRLDPYTFRPINWENDKLLPNTLLIGTPTEIPPQPNPISEIHSATGDVILRIVKTPP